MLASVPCWSRWYDGTATIRRTTLQSCSSQTPTLHRRLVVSTRPALKTKGSLENQLNVHSRYQCVTPGHVPFTAHLLGFPPHTASTTTETPSWIRNCELGLNTILTVQIRYDAINHCAGILAMQSPLPRVLSARLWYSTGNQLRYQYSRLSVQVFGSVELYCGIYQEVCQRPHKKSPQRPLHSLWYRPYYCVQHPKLPVLKDYCTCAEIRSPLQDSQPVIYVSNDLENHLPRAQCSKESKEEAPKGHGEIRDRVKKSAHSRYVAVKATEVNKEKSTNAYGGFKVPVTNIPQTSL